jgi:hypothetical protein
MKNIDRAILITILVTLLIEAAIISMPILLNIFNEVISPILNELTWGFGTQIILAGGLVTIILLGYKVLRRIIEGLKGILAQYEKGCVIAITTSSMHLGLIRRLSQLARSHLRDLFKLQNKLFIIALTPGDSWGSWRYIPDAFNILKLEIKKSGEKLENGVNQRAQETYILHRALNEFEKRLSWINRQGRNPLVIILRSEGGSSLSLKKAGWL